MRWRSLAVVFVICGLGSRLALADDVPLPTPQGESEPEAAAEGGGGGAPAEEPKEKEPHPEPRVIIDAAGPGASGKRSKTTDAVQAAARRGFWGKAVGCYKLAAWEDPKLAIDATLRIDIRGGAVKKASLQKPAQPKKKTKKKKAAKSKADEVGACLAKRLVGLSMPKGVRTSTSLRVQIYPGDDPISAPPKRATQGQKSKPEVRRNRSRNRKKNVSSAPRS